MDRSPAVSPNESCQLTKRRIAPSCTTHVTSRPIASHDMDVTQLNAEQRALDRSRGYNEVHDARYPHWKDFWLGSYVAALYAALPLGLLMARIGLEEWFLRHHLPGYLD